MTSEIIYQGDLRTQATHLQSGDIILTDAPKDNHGKGEAFSPTDLVATALGSCMLSIMGIIANRHEINILGTQVSIHKIMQANPRRIAAIEVTMYMPNVTYTPKERALLENAARTCPVALSLHPELEQKLSFVYQ
ncbi:MAG: OsmC family protein [Chitinophagales bacterium]|jgi:putative redox protein|nr:OsmC family protein [Sphingobacteriales bacterium]MBP6665046.1 OsmC family protein [Chitinophagales bacterium]MBP7534377.1 OsmC family protein [Chitinophagales bacterium]